ncbi:hypothetical protein PV721_30900 [Streptomyces sp. MB09-01]|uniref:hypothetical protein n=1 Tax=unclassified Streptomyces TaxID=2593676 RepID=UPI0029A1266C|nr:hypothetical protein [Streptomyces sp. MB09-01]MDX3538675.1 hypothetical protein [Streptomyces sp. MB09-01]
MASTIPEQPVTRELMLLGDAAPGRRGDRTVVAESHVEIDVVTDDALDRCIEALRASDERLAAQPDSLYDWNRTWVERSDTGGGKVIFDVVWYDEEFFEDKKDTYMSPDHLAIYTRIGAEEGSLSVSHWRKVPS